MHNYSGKEKLSNLTFATPSGKKMGDNDGPAYCVYSNVGYNKAEFTFEMPLASFGGVADNGTKVNGYLFLGVDVHDGTPDGMNCCDAGFVTEADGRGWHLFINTLHSSKGASGEWKSNTPTLDPTHIYKLILDTSTLDETAVLTAYDLTDDKVADSITFRLWGAKKDGTNTSFLTNAAIDWTVRPESDFIGKTNANVHQNLYLTNLKIYGINLYKDDKKYSFDTDHRAIWPDKNMPVAHECVKVHHITKDDEYVIDIDMR